MLDKIKREHPGTLFRPPVHPQCEPGCMTYQNRPPEAEIKVKVNLGALLLVNIKCLSIRHEVYAE